jgi:uncharacterized protein DUF4397
VGRILGLMSLCACILGLGTIFLLAGCGSGGNTRFRLLNAVPDESSLNVLVDSTSGSSNLAYGTSTGYLSEKSGSHQVGIEPSASRTTLLRQSISFASGSDTTVISYNFSSSIANMVLTDNNSAPASGDFKIRLVNASPNLGPADVYIVTPGTPLSTVSPTLSKPLARPPPTSLWPQPTMRSNSPRQARNSPSSTLARSHSPRARFGRL